MEWYHPATSARGPVIVEAFLVDNHEQIVPCPRDFVPRCRKFSAAFGFSSIRGRSDYRIITPAERADRATGRCRLRTDIDVRWPDTNSYAGRARRKWASVHALPCCRLVFAYACLIDDRAQPSRSWNGYDNELGEQ